MSAIVDLSDGFVGYALFQHVHMFDIVVFCWVNTFSILPCAIGALKMKTFAN